MKTININKPFLKLLTMTGALCALLLSGCGGGGGSTQSTLPNEGKAVNSLGYYGDGVYFGSKPIVKDWEASLLDNYETYTFDSHGMMTIDYPAYLQKSPSSSTYGVNANGTEFTIVESVYESNDTKVIYHLEKEEANCFTVRQLRYRNNSLENNISMQLCTKHPVATLEPISNAGKTSNALGYYGESVKLGNDLVTGNWLAIGPGIQTALFFDANATMASINSTGDQYAVIVCPSHDTYGISEDGKSVYNNNGGLFFEITGLFEGCYRAKDRQNIEYKLCKMENNDTAWTQYCR